MLIIISLIIILYSYYRNYQAIAAISKRELGAVAENVKERFNDIRVQSIFLAEITKGIVSQRPENVINDPFLKSYLLDLLQNAPNLSGVSIALQDGTYLSAINLLTANTFHYFGKPDIPLPNGTKFAIRTITSEEVWEYLGTDRKVLAQEKIEPISYSVHDSAWFKNMENWPDDQWSTTLFPRGGKDGVKGISLNLPLFDEKNNFFGAVGINITLSILSDYIYHYQFSRNGKTFILNSKGKLLVPPLEDIDPESKAMATSVVPDAFGQYKASGLNFSEIVKNGVRYLVYVEKFPLSIETPWYIVIAVPSKDFFGDLINTQNKLALISCLIFLLFGYLIYLFSKHIANPIKQMAKEVDNIRHLDYEKKLEVDSQIDEILTLESSIAAMQTAMKSFGKYVPKEIVKTLIDQGEEIALSGKKTQVAILFTDIKDFTTLAEGTSVEQLMHNLESYFGVLSKIIIKSEGTIDKYIGDSIMAFWGAPKSVEDQTKKACLTALLCHKACNINYKEQHLLHWTTRFGLHAGEVIVGNIGTTERMNYTIIGDAVNVASRVTALNKIYQTSIIITEEVKNQLSDEFITRPLDYLTIKGKTVKTMIYELAGIGDLALKKLCEQFSIGYALYNERKRAEAKKQFLEVLRQFPDDGPTKIYLERLRS